MANATRDLIPAGYGALISISNPGHSIFARPYKSLRPCVTTPPPSLYKPSPSIDTKMPISFAGAKLSTSSLISLISLIGRTDRWLPEAGNGGNGWTGGRGGNIGSNSSGHVRQNFSHAQVGTSSTLLSFPLSSPPPPSSRISEC